MAAGLHTTRRQTQRFSHHPHRLGQFDHVIVRGQAVGMKAAVVLPRKRNGGVGAHLHAHDIALLETRASEDSGSECILRHQAVKIIILDFPEIAAWALLWSGFESSTQFWLRGPALFHALTLYPFSTSKVALRSPALSSAVSAVTRACVYCSPWSNQTAPPRIVIFLDCRQ